MAQLRSQQKCIGFLAFRSILRVLMIGIGGNGRPEDQKACQSVLFPGFVKMPDFRILGLHSRSLLGLSFRQNVMTSLTPRLTTSGNLIAIRPIRDSSFFLRLRRSLAPTFFRPSSNIPFRLQQILLQSFISYVHCAWSTPYRSWAMAISKSVW
jgi:hypothetical protein